MKIRLLPDSVINTIAAGEVVDRPASVIKELVDNALDSGAQHIRITVQGAGSTSIKVRDDGCGMSRDDALLAFERHATSKLSSVDDLWELVTLGFRGEALASIASVAKVRLLTREANSELATEVTIHGGKVEKVTFVPGAVGTEIEVRHLFYNVPARRKFLKSPRVEALRIESIVRNMAIAAPSIAFSLTIDGETKLELPAGDTFRKRVRRIVRGSLVEFDRDAGEAGKVCGVVGHPSSAVSDAGSLILVVNNRIVTDRVLNRAVKEGFDSMLKSPEWPLGVVQITLPARDVDVNVHPQKAEVRFSHPDQVFELVRDAVLTAVQTFKGPVMATRFAAPDPIVSRLSPSQPVSSGQPWNSDVRQVNDPIVVQQPLFSSHNVALAVEPDRNFSFQSLRYLGQVAACYLVFEGADGMVVVDMHAAHERINFNRIRAALRTGERISQALLLSERVELSPNQLHRLQEAEQHLQRAGLELTFQESAVIVTAVPTVPARLNVAAFLREIASEESTPIITRRLEEIVDFVAARLACHASVRSGDLLGVEEVRSLLVDLDSAELGAACPHGRPVVVSFDTNQIERWFGRDR